MRRAYLSIPLFSLFISPVLASAGDRAEDFIQCVDLCDTRNCDLHSTYTMPVALRLTRWTCREDCQYACMHEITDKNMAHGLPIVQYYGKWPFWRFAGFQEPASVAFSVVNFLAHWNGYKKIQEMVPAHHPMKVYYLRWSIVNMNAWVWSSVFHIRDRPTTEKLDYFSAALAILYALYYSTLRIFQLYPTPHVSKLTLSERPTRTLGHKVLALACSTAYIGHISYLSLMPRFDYAYNIAFNVCIGLVHNAIWLCYSLPSSLSLLFRFPSQTKSYRPAFVTKAALLVLLTTAATGLELFDFTPILGVIDAHSLWHLSTVPIAYMWYNFLVEDSLDPSWRDQRL